MRDETTASDAQLVEQAAHNNAAAFSAIYERHLSALYDYARRLMRDADEAADVVQVAFIKAFESIRSDGGTPRMLRPWLFQIAHNEAFDRLRRRRFVEPEGEETLAQIPDRSEAASPATLAEQRETADLVWRAVRGLRPQEQELLLLSVREGLDAGEIAQVIGKKRETVHVALSRARDAFEDAFTTLLLVTRGSRACAQLAALTQGVDLSPRMRRQVRRHVETCQTCAEKRRAYAEEMAVFAVLAPVQVPAATKAAMWQQISHSLAAPPPGNPPPGQHGPWRPRLNRSPFVRGARRLPGNASRPWLTAALVTAVPLLVLGVATHSAFGLWASPVGVLPTAEPVVGARTTPLAQVQGAPPTPALAPVAAEVHLPIPVVPPSATDTPEPTPSGVAKVPETPATTSPPLEETEGADATPAPQALAAAPTIRPGQPGAGPTTVPTSAAEPALEPTTAAESPELLAVPQPTADDASTAVTPTDTAPGVTPTEPATPPPTPAAAAMAPTSESSPATPRPTPASPTPRSTTPAVPPTSVPATDTPVAPTRTSLPTATPLPPTDTPVPPTRTPLPTDTPAPTSSPTATPGVRARGTATPTATTTGPVIRLPAGVAP
jgi:RNA polymerase sigma factor (sigma-70 family)